MTVVPIDLSIYDDEATLLKGLQEGDNNACACMLKRFAPRVYAIALRMVNDPPGCGGSDSGDLHQRLQEHPELRGS